MLTRFWEADKAGFLGRKVIGMWEKTKDFVLGPKVHPGGLPLLHLDEINWTQEASECGCFIIGAPRCGKTTLLATVTHVMLCGGHGGVVLAAKVGVADKFKQLAVKAGRGDDVVIIGDGLGQCYNPLADLDDPADVAALVVELDNIINGGAKLGVDESAFWKGQRAILLRYLCVLVKAADGVITFGRIAKVFNATPNSVQQAEDPSWRARSEFWKVVEKTRGANDDVGCATEYFLETFAAKNSRLTDSARSMVDCIMEPLKESRIRALIDGPPTVRMRDVFDRRKIIAVGTSTEQTHHGRIINAIVMHCFSVQASKTPPANRTFILIDECQKLVTPEALGTMAFIREARVTMVLATQSLSVLRERLTENAAKGLAGLAGLKIIGRQDDEASCEWVSKSIGEHKVRKETVTHSGGKVSRSYHYVRERRVFPEEVATLEQGQTFCLFEGRHVKVSWPAEPPDDGRGVKIPRWLKS